MIVALSLILSTDGTGDKIPTTEISAIVFWFFLACWERNHKIGGTKAFIKLPGQKSVPSFQSFSLWHVFIFDR